MRSLSDLARQRCRYCRCRAGFLPQSLDSLTLSLREVLALRKPRVGLAACVRYVPRVLAGSEPRHQRLPPVSARDVLELGIIDVHDGRLGSRLHDLSLSRACTIAL